MLVSPLYYLGVPKPLCKDLEEIMQATLAAYWDSDVGRDAGWFYGG